MEALAVGTLALLLMLGTVAATHSSQPRSDSPASKRSLAGR